MGDFTNRKLTLSLDSNVIDFAHDFSRKTNKPISKIVEIFFLELRNSNTSGLSTYSPFL
ncbi:DUF6364 family protein [Treponema primitia]|uniref:DUF6364 family protein n=1 Tax=Treponema primitia TaxID=88058 RepID=UPI003CCAB337